jgi:ribosome-binding factor A
MERLEKIKNLVREACAEYLQTISNNTSLITITDVVVTPDIKQATLFISVYPTSGEESALNFAKRHRADMRDYLRKKMSTRAIPFLEIKIDAGEKHRQRIDELLRQG